MRIFCSLACLLLIGLSPMNCTATTLITLINEDFSTGTGYVTSVPTWSNNGLNWVWSRAGSSGVAPTGTEVFPSSGSTARGLPNTHGGFEVFSVSSSEPASGTIWQVAVQVTLPTSYPDVWNGNTISFDMGYRSAVSTSSFELFNITDNRSLLSQSITGSAGSWKTVTISPTFTATDAGDVVELRWRDTAAASTSLASGLEVGAVRFDVVPEPAVGSLFLLGLGLVVRRRRRVNREIR